MTPRGDLSGVKGWLVGRLLAPLSDPRERDEFLADLEALRRRRGRGRLWKWQELVRYAWALRVRRPTGLGRRRTGGGRSAAALLESVSWDVRHSVRQLARAPSLTLVALPTIALAVGATTALFSFTDALLLRPLDVRDPHGLVALFHVFTDGPRSYSEFSYPDYVDLRDRSRLLEGVAAYSSIEVGLGGEAGAERVEGLIVSGNYFEVLGVKPLRGRTFTPDEDRTEGTHPVVVIGQGLFERSFAADPALVGGVIEIDGSPFTVVGVVPRSTPTVDLEARPEVWVPLMMHGVVLSGFRAFGTELFGNRGTHWLQLVARLTEGVDRRAAAEELRALAGWQAAENPETNTGWSVALGSARDARAGVPSGRPLARLSALLAAVVGMVLLIACANVANLLLAGALERRQEMGIRLAMGANRQRILRQNLTESVVLAAVGGCLGLALAALTMRVIPTLGFTSAVPGLDIRLDTRVLCFTLMVVVLTGIAFGLMPALQASSSVASGSVRRASGAGARGRSRLRQALVVVQVALSLVLLIGAGLTLRTLWNLQSVPLGFRVDGLITAVVDLTESEATPEADAGVYQRIATEVSAVPGVNDVAMALIAPFSPQRMANDLLWEGGGASGTMSRTNVDMNVVGVGYFRTMGIPLQAGRPFDEGDQTGSPGVTIVNEALASRLWPESSALGRRLWSWRPDGNHVPLEVVGVVADGRYYRSWQGADRPFAFLPLAQNPSRTMVLHVRAAAVGPALSDAIREAVVDARPEIPAPEITRGVDAMADAVAFQRTNARLLSLFGLLATAIALVGVYGVVSYAVSKRTFEIGVRLALGARPTDVRQAVLLVSARSILAGSALGLLAAAVLTRFIAPILYGVEPLDSLTFASLAVGLTAVGLLASDVPARRATRVDPAVVLRQ